MPDWQEQYINPKAEQTFDDWQGTKQQTNLSNNYFQNNRQNSQNMLNNEKKTMKDMWQNLKTQTVMPYKALWQFSENVGELAAAAKLAYDYKKRMDEAGKKLVKTFGPGQGADIDNYYHPLLQCELAKISPRSRAYGIALGYGKESLDYLKKRFLQGMDHGVLMEDIEKDCSSKVKMLHEICKVKMLHTVG